jgi:Glyoxalase-like domain
MGTHNRLLRIDGPDFPRAYLEIIAIDPAAAPPGRVRWFGLDDPALQAGLRDGPRLVHAVARTPNVEMLRWGLITLAQDPGTPLAATRDTPEGRLSWRILVRDDGALPGGGRLPTLIEWQGRHPAEALPASAVALAALNFGALTPREARLLRLRGATCKPGGPALAVSLTTPRGDVHLSA